MTIPCETKNCPNYANLIWKGRPLCISCAQAAFRSQIGLMKAKFFAQIERLNDEFKEALSKGIHIIK